MAGTTQPDDGVVPFPSHAAERERERERHRRERQREREREREFHQMRARENRGKP